MEKYILKNYTPRQSCGSERGFYVVAVIVSVLASERVHWPAVNSLSAVGRGVPLSGYRHLDPDIDRKTRRTHPGQSWGALKRALI